VRKLEQQARNWGRLDTFSALARALNISVAELVEPSHPQNSASSVAQAFAERQCPPDHLSADVLARPDFAEACAGRDLGSIFTIANEWGGAGFTFSHLARRCEMTVSQVRDYMTRGRQAQEVRIFERVADGLHIPGRMLGIGRRPWESQDASELVSFQPAGRAFVASWAVDGTLVATREVSEDPVDRRSFLLLTGVALTSPAHEWLIARPLSDVSSSAGRRTITPELVDQLDDITGKIRHMDDQMGGGSLIKVVRGQVTYVAQLIREGRYSDSVGRRLHGTLGELLRLGGWVSYDDGDVPQAQRFWVAALHAAHTAGDAALGANVLGFMSEPAWNLGRPEDAGRLTATALAGYKGRSPRVSAILHMRAAVADAANGDADECRRAIDSAYGAFRNSPPECGEPGWCYWMDDRSLNEMTGVCLISLNDYPSAIRHLELALPEPDGQDSYVRDRVESLTRLATAYARQGEPEQACVVGMRAIDTLSSQVDSARLTAQVQRLRNDLAPYRRTSAVEEFSDRVDELAADRPA
jgi:hypothetical protein